MKNTYLIKTNSFIFNQTSSNHLVHLFIKVSNKYPPIHLFNQVNHGIN